MSASQFTTQFAILWSVGIEKKREKKPFESQLNHTCPGDHNYFY